MERHNNSRHKSSDRDNNLIGLNPRTALYDHWNYALGLSSHLEDITHTIKCHIISHSSIANPNGGVVYLWALYKYQ